MSKPQARAMVHFECHKHGTVHELSVAVPRPLPPQLQAPEPSAAGGGTRLDCLPTDLTDRVMDALGRGLGRWLQLGYVEVGA